MSWWIPNKHPEMSSCWSSEVQEASQPCLCFGVGIVSPAGEPGVMVR